MAALVLEYAASLKITLFCFFARISFVTTINDVGPKYGNQFPVHRCD